MTKFRSPIAHVLSGILFAGTGAAVPGEGPRSGKSPDEAGPATVGRPFEGRMDWTGLEGD